MITTGVGKAPGYFNHEGGTVCAEHAKEKWKFGSFDDDNMWVWTSDAQLEITCMENIEKGTREAHKDEKKVVDKATILMLGI